MSKKEKVMRERPTKHEIFLEEQVMKLAGDMEKGRADQREKDINLRVIFTKIVKGALGLFYKWIEIAFTFGKIVAGKEAFDLREGVADMQQEMSNVYKEIRRIVVENNLKVRPDENMDKDVPKI